MQNTVAILIFAFVLMLLSLLPGWDLQADHPSEQRVPIVVHNPGA